MGEWGATPAQLELDQATAAVSAEWAQLSQRIEEGEQVIENTRLGAQPDHMLGEMTLDVRVAT